MFRWPVDNSCRMCESSKAHLPCPPPWLTLWGECALYMWLLSVYTSPRHCSPALTWSRDCIYECYQCTRHTRNTHHAITYTNWSFLHDWLLLSKSTVPGRIGVISVYGRVWLMSPATHWNCKPRDLNSDLARNSWMSLARNSWMSFPQSHSSFPELCIKGNVAYAQFIKPVTLGRFSL